MMNTSTLQSLRHSIKKTCTANGLSDESDYLICLALQQTRAWVYANSEYQPNPKEIAHLEQLVTKRVSNTPLAYLRTTQEFYSLDFEVNNHVLIPRPETEIIVAQAIALLPKQAQVIDMGTGCGNIAISIASHRPDVDITAIDISVEALNIAQRNATRHRCDIRLIQSDWYTEINEHFDCIISNPPYIAPDDCHIASSVASSEPHQALYASENGLSELRQVIEGARTHLNKGGLIIVEHGWHQATAVTKLMQQAGFESSQSISDEAGNPRCTIAKYSS